MKKNVSSLIKSTLFLTIPGIFAIADAHANSGPLNWVGGNGDFLTPTNWRPEATPGAANTVRFDGATPLTVSTSAPTSILSLEVNTTNGGNTPSLTLNLAGGNLRVGDEKDKETAFLRLNSTQESGPRTLAITGGTFWSPVVSISVNPKPGAPASRILVTEKGRFEALRYIYVGNKGEGILEVTGEGEVDSKGYLRVAEGDGSKGKVILDGSQARLVCGSRGKTRSGLAFIGGRGDGILEVKNGAKVEGFLVQAARGSADQPAGTGKGKIQITGRDSVLTCGQLFIGGGRANLQKAQVPVKDGVGEIQLLSGGIAEVEEFSVFEGSTLVIDSKSKLSVIPQGSPVNSGATLNADSTLELIMEPSGDQAPIRVTAPIQIQGAKLKLSPGTTAQNSQKTIPLIDYNGGTLSGTFQGLADGAQIKSADGKVYSIDYGLKGSNIVTLNLK